MNNVISDRASRRKRRRRFWAIVRGLVSFVLASAILLASAWLKGDLRWPAAAPAQNALQGTSPGEIRPIAIVSEMIEPPAFPAPGLRSPRRLHATDQRGAEAGAVEESLEIVTAAELADISQVHRSRPIP